MNMEREITEREKILNKNKHLISSDNNSCCNYEEKIMMFLSYDITDSTNLKIKYPEKWSLIIKDLLNNKFEYMDFWKFNGDEILYKKQINNVDFLCKIIEESYKFLKTLQNIMQEKIQDINIKGTLWIMLAESELSGGTGNFSFDIGDFNDFCGKHMDEGFRLTKCSSITKLAIDPKIIYILLHKFAPKPDGKEENYETKENIKSILTETRLIGYCKCKGIWNNNPYPIYWYYKGISSDEGIMYNEFLNDEHLWPKRSEFKPLCDNNNDVHESYSNIKDIYKFMGASKEIEKLADKLTFNGDICESSEGKANLYYMVACINPRSNKVLIARRSEERKHLKHVWDFGNVKHQNVAMKDTIIKEYKNTFGIDISLVIDEDRDENIKPFGYCTIYRNCKPHNSLLCYALIKSPDLDDEDLIKYIMDYMKRNKESGAKLKYDEIRFVDSEYDLKGFKSLTLDEIREDSEQATKGNSKTFDENTCIMYFRNSIKGAIKECTNSSD